MKKDRMKIKKLSRKNLIPKLYVAVLILFGAVNCLKAQTLTPTPEPIQKKLTSLKDSLPTDTKAEKITIDRQTFLYIKWLISEAETQDKLIASLEAENKLLSERIKTEQQKTELLTQLNEARKKEAEYWKTANDENKQIIGLNKEMLANNAEQIEILKKRKTGILTQLKAFSYGVGAGVLLRSLL